MAAPIETSPCYKSKRANRRFALTKTLAEWTGLEPATPGVTGRYSNQLNYHSLVQRAESVRWWVLRGSNSRHSPCKGDALPTELSTPAGRVLIVWPGRPAPEGPASSGHSNTAAHGKVRQFTQSFSALPARNFGT